MLLITTEERATPFFKKYKNTVAFSLAKGAKGITDDDGKIIANYETLGFLPDEDTINGIKAGDIKLKKVIKDAKKAIASPSMDDAGISLGMAQVITMLTSNRKAPVVMVIIEDEDDPARNKILKKYIKAVFEMFGITPVKVKKIKKAKLLKGRKKKVRDAVTRFNYKTKGCRLSKRGADLKKLILCFYELELRQSGMAGMQVSDLDREETKACVKNLLRTFTATNLQAIESKKICKRLAKKDKAAVEAYDELRDILGTMEGGYELPKVKYGQKKKKGKAVGPKMDVKKFEKFFLGKDKKSVKKAKKNRPALIIVYGHILARLLDFEIGSKEYNAHMKSVCEPFGADFVKAYVAAANAYVKGNA